MQAIDRNFKSSFEHASFIAKKGEYGKCISYINQELKLMEKDTQNLYHGRSLYLFAKCKIMIYDYDKVDIILDNSIKILANNDDHYFLSNAYFYKFNISFNNDKFNKGEIYIRKSIIEWSLWAPLLYYLIIIFSSNYPCYSIFSSLYTFPSKSFILKILSSNTP